MANNNKKKEPSKNRFNYYWIYGIVLVGLLVLQFFPMNPSLQEISQEKFFNEMIRQGDVKKIEVVNNELVFDGGQVSTYVQSTLNISAPYLLIISSGEITFPIDLDIFLPLPSTTNP